MECIGREGGLSDIVVVLYLYCDYQEGHCLYL